MLLITKSIFSGGEGMMRNGSDCRHVPITLSRIVPASLRRLRLFLDAIFGGRSAASPALRNLRRAPQSNSNESAAVTEDANRSTSRISGFHKLSAQQRIDRVAAFAGLGEEHRRQLAAPSNIDAHLADHMIENMVTTIAIPVGIATNLRVDGRDVLVPMATEESSVV
ncbi:MAG TPA: hypothetical protein VLG14_14665, partial [Sphingomonas sp.]|nr:hypothetical protein [Sphingomonas sp.]